MMYAVLIVLGLLGVGNPPENVRRTAVNVDSLFVNKGADVCLPDHELNTPLHFACHHGCLPVIKALMEHGAHLFVKTQKGNYPLACAVNNDKKDVVSYLVHKYYH